MGIITRCYDPILVDNAIKSLLKYDTVDVHEWLANPENIVLIDEDNNMALFEKGIKHIYSGHYFFQCRGKKALTVARNFLDNLFNSCYNIDVLMGLVPLRHLGARWLSRQLGFKSQGIIKHYDQPYEMFILYKKDFNV